MIPARATRLGLIVAASLLAHSRGLFSPPLDYHHHRQVNTAAIARNYHRHGPDFLSPRIDWRGDRDERAATEFPLYMWLVGLLWPVGGLGELWGRLLSVLFSAATAAYLWRFLERETTPDAAFYGAVLFPFLPLEMYFGRTIQPESLALLGTIAALHHWSLHLEEGRSLGHWALAVLWAFLAIAHKLPYAYALVPLAFLAWEKLGAKAWRSAAVWAAPLAVAAGVLGWYRFASAGVYVVPAHRGEFLDLLKYSDLARFVTHQALSRFPELAATYGGLILLAFGFRELVLRKGRLFFAVWWGAVALHLAAGGLYAYAHEYTSLPFTLVNAAFIGAGLEALLARARALAGPARRWALAGLALLCVSVPVHAGFRISHWYGLNFPFLANARRAADRVSSPTDLFITNQRAESVYLYYLDRKGWSWELPEAGEERSFAQVEDRIRDGARFFMTAKDSGFETSSGPYARWFYRRFPVVLDEGGILIFRLRP